MERRKSRRHSTGNTTQSPYPPPRFNNSAIGQTLDEDSSSSANSGEANEVFGMPKGPHELAGVTPALRRRRERVERQKSFMREQQEAVAAGIRPFELKDSISNQGKDCNCSGRSRSCIACWFSLCACLHSILVPHSVSSHFVFFRFDLMY